MRLVIEKAMSDRVRIASVLRIGNMAARHRGEYDTRRRNYLAHVVDSKLPSDRIRGIRRVPHWRLKEMARQAEAYERYCAAVDCGLLEGDEADAALEFTDALLTHAKHHDGSTENGVVYTWSLLNMSGAGFRLFREPHHTDSHMEEAEKWLRNNHDVVALRVTRVPSLAQ